MFDDCIKKYRHELINSVIPFWETNCIDTEYGGFFTFLDRDGSVYDTDKYMWMQWRIVYMFAELYLSEYSRPEWLGIAENGFEFLYNNGRDDSGKYYFSLNRKGEPAIAPYSIYSDCFAAMGSAVLYKCTGKKEYHAAAVSAMDNYISRIDNPKGHWEKSMSGRGKRLTLGHYMMLANLGVIMKQNLDSDQYAGEIPRAIDMVTEKFWNSEYKVIFENINSDFTFDLNSCDGRHLIPGHGLESMWFFLRYAEQKNDTEIVEKVAEMILSLLEFSWDRENGGIYYFMDVLGKPHLELQWDMKLWWAHNEAIIACLYALYLTEKPIFEEWFQRLDEWTWNHFPDPEYGEWFGYLNRKGELTHLLKGGKWKTFFHLPRFLLLSIELMNKIQDRKD